MGEGGDEEEVREQDEGRSGCWRTKTPKAAPKTHSRSCLR